MLSVRVAPATALAAFGLIPVLARAQDAPPAAAPVAAAELGKAGNRAFADRFNERLRDEIDPAWAGERPRTMLIDRDGKETVLAGVVDLAEVPAGLDARNKR